MLKRESALEIFNNHKSFICSSTTIKEMQHITKINLRGNSNNTNFMSAANKILKATLPTKPNTFIGNNNIKNIWLSPNEWLITDEYENNKKKLINKLNQIFESFDASVTDVSENRTIIRISGKKIFTLLAKFLTIDLHTALSRTSSVAQTLFVKAPVLLVRVNENNSDPIIDIFTIRSHSNYIYQLLVDGTKNLYF